MRYVFIINPTAGKGKQQPIIAESIKKYFKGKKEKYKILFTESRFDATKKAKAEAEKGDEVCIFACGGEGTGLEVINGIVGYKNVTYGVIPCGSANDFLKFFGHKDAFFDIADQVSGKAIDIDLIKTDDCYCVNGCSIGMDAMVASDMMMFKNWPLVSGPMAYKLAIVKTFLKKLGVQMEILLDGISIGHKNCLFAVVANAPYYGGGYNAAPTAVPFDGKLNFTLVDVISKLKVPSFLSKYESGSHGNLDYCHMRECSSMDIIANKPLPINLDGEIVYKDKMHFEIVKKGIKFLLPKTVANEM